MKAAKLPPQCKFWRFLNLIHSGVALPILFIQQRMREAVWAAGNIRLKSVTINADTIVQTLYGDQIEARKSYNPRNKGMKRYQPILFFLAETKGFIAGELRNGDGPAGKQINRHLQEAFQPLPQCVTSASTSADSGFYCWEAVKPYEKSKCQFM